MGDILCAVDVGTRSARAGIFSTDGRMLSRCEAAFALYEPGHGHAEYQSSDIWTAVTTATRKAVIEAGVDPASVIGICFDATCSLVVLTADGRPVSVSQSGETGRDTIAWLDHRAISQAEEASSIGPGFSPEMQPPKLMWLKRHLPDRWQQVGLLFDLADYLSFRASGSLARSNSTLTCKWGYRAGAEAGWPMDFLSAIGLEDLLTRGNLPDSGTVVGDDLGPLTASAAIALGLSTRCRVAAGLIDAYAGALGALGADAGNHAALSGKAALVAGTSSVIMLASPAPIDFPGIWGPYYNAALPGLWMSEGGQSASGALLDHIIRCYGSGETPSAALHQEISARIRALQLSEGADLAPGIHILPDFHGNRTPLADPLATGVISGLTLDTSFDGLCRLYWRTIVALALGLRQVMDAIADAGYPLTSLAMSGGHARNPLLVDTYADVLGRPILVSAAPDVTLLGTAMSAATAAGCYPDLGQAGRAMAQPVRTIAPDPASEARYDRDYRVFLRMQAQRREINALIAGANGGGAM